MALPGTASIAKDPGAMARTGEQLGKGATEFRADSVILDCDPAPLRRLATSHRGGGTGGSPEAERAASCAAPRAAWRPRPIPIPGRTSVSR